MTRDRVLASAVVLSAVFWAYACGDAGTAPPPHDPVPTAVVVEPGVTTLAAIGATAQITAEVTDQNGWAMTDPPLSWSSSDVGVASVDAAGVVTAAANGTATVTATSGGASGTATVTVAQEAAGSLALVPDSALLGGTGGAVRLLAPDSLLITSLGVAARVLPRGSDANGQALGYGANVTWASTNPAVVTVEASGLVTAVANGRADVTATSGPTSAKLTVVVSDLSADADARALVALYEATDGPNWVNNDNWLTHAPLGEWHGVTVDGEGRVVSLWFAEHSLADGNNLTGTIPPELGSLASLKSLGLNGNRLTGNIPSELGNLANLEALLLNGNNLTGAIPPELGNLPNLERLWLSNNNLTGNIPPELGSLANLTGLFLHYNSLTGSIPPELGNLAYLEWLDLYTNSLTGSIPPELGNLAYLQVLQLSHNDLTGVIPTELGSLANLQVLDLAINGLTGTIPPELGNLASIQWLALDRNGLTGPIPTELGSLANLDWLVLGSNNLTGTIPPELGNLANLQFLALDVNRLTGAIPSELGNLASLERLWLYSNDDLSGHLPRTFLGLGALRQLLISRTNVCVPDDQAFQDWLNTLERYSGQTCAPRGISHR